MASDAFDDDTEFFFESLKGIIVKFEDGTITTMDQEMRKAYATAELEYAAEQLAEQLAEQSNAVATGKPKSKPKGKENRKENRKK
jgi:hypothetical protein